MKTLLGLFGLAALAFAVAPAQVTAADAKIVLIAGTPSHPPGAHEFNAGTKLLVKWLKEIPGVDPVFVAGGWPADESVFDGAKAVVFYMDGGAKHPMIQGERRETMRKLMDQGVGLVCIHYAVEFPKGKFGDQLLEWLGGYYETGYSDNPHNEADLVPKEGHPITRGVKPFRALDEWYYKIRFRRDDPRLTTILTAKSLVDRKKNVFTDQTVAWAIERKDGGRSFGFTGAHFHKSWGNPDFRSLILNAIVWTAKLDVPSEGVKAEVTEEELGKNLDPKPPQKKK
jgi:type 1 glutamine amidotransferase